MLEAEVPTEQSHAEPSKGERLGFIEGLRGIAALYVVFQHVCTMIDPSFTMKRPDAQPVWLAKTMGLLWYGHFAVAAFIVLSGFCLQMSLYGRGDGQLRDIKRFLKRRCWRILPPYYACLALSLVVCASVTSKQKGQPWDQYLPVTFENTLAHVLMGQNLSRDWMYKINGVLWSISIEFQLYFLFPAIAWTLWRYGGRWVLPTVTGLGILVLYFYPQSEKLYLWYGPLFVLGMAGARWAFDARLRRPDYLPLMGLFVLAFAAAIASISWTKELAWRDTLMGIAIVALLIAGVSRPNAAWAQFIGSPLIKGLGAFSYSLYLMHHPILQVLYVSRPPWASTVTREFGYLVLTIPIILVVTYGFYRAFEKPFINRGKSSGIPTPPVEGN